MPLTLYNTLTKKLEPFQPLDPAGKRVLFYTCGPTVYDYAHIGNFRSFLNADLLRRVLELLGYEVRHVMNMTDVGHMTDDEVADGGGQDKMAAAADRLREAQAAGSLPVDSARLDPGDPKAIAEFYITAFLEDARTLGLKVAAEAESDPLLMPRPTQYVEQMIALVQQLLDKGHAYVAEDGVVYFDVKSFPTYGQLSGNTPDRLRAGEGGRVSESNQEAKRHPADFMLWKPDSTHLMRWPSPWGEGYPGWHLECSVMAQSLLDEVIDIHSGGEDNIFPHHECEIAQSCAAGKHEHFSMYWFHTRFLIVEGQKMSKSLGNFFTVRDLLSRGGSPAAIRLALTGTHYRSNANFTMQGLVDAQRQIDRWKRLLSWLSEAQPEGAAGGPLHVSLGRFTDTITDDLNVSGAIGTLNEGVGAYDTSTEPTSISVGELDALKTMMRTLGILDLDASGRSLGGDETRLIESKIADRLDARSSKDWAKADQIRDELLLMGVEIKDGPDGTTWERVVRDWAVGNGE